MYFVFTVKLLASDKGERVIRLGEFKEGELLGKKLIVLEDKSSALTLPDVLAKESSLLSRPTDQNVVNLGFTNSTIWVKLNIENPSSESKELFLEFSYPVIDNVSFFSMDGLGNWQEKKAGDAVAQIQVDLPENRNPSFLMETKPGLSTHYLQIKSQGALQIPIKLWTKENLRKAILMEYSVLCLIYGVFLVMILYNILLCLWFRSIAYFYYVLFISCSTLNMMNLQGFTQIVFPSEMAMMLSTNISFAANLSVVLCLSFGSLFLNLRQESVKFHWIFRGMTLVAFLGIIAGLFSYNAGIKIFILCTFVVSILMLAGGIYRSLQGFRPAYFFHLGLGFHTRRPCPPSAEHDRSHAY